MGRSRTAAALALSLVLGAGALASCDDPGALEPALQPGGVQALTASGSSASLLYCPNRERVEKEARIGPEGGTLKVAGHSITLLPGAVAEPVTIRFRVLESDYLEVDIDANGLPDDRFLVPAEIVLSYERCKDRYESETSFTAWYIDGTTGALLENMGGTTDPASHSVAFTTGHLSLYALAN